MGLSLGKWSIGKTSGASALDKARLKVVDDLRHEQKRLKGEASSDSPQAEIGPDGVGQVKIFYRYFNLLGQDNCVRVGEVSGDSELAEKIDEVIDLVNSGQLDDALNEALKKEKRDKARDQKGMTNK